MSELVAITSGQLTARIAPLGAELWSLTDAGGAEWMTDGDPAFWGGHAPLLFPIVGSLAQDRYRLGGETYSLPRHGFARRSAFELAEHRADHARFRLSDSAETRAVYPFAFTLDMAFRVEGMTLEMAATVTNPGREALPFSFGYHPAFAWPLPGGGGKDAHRLVFEQDEPQPVRRVSRESGLLLAEMEPTPVRGRELALSEDLFRADAVIWDHLSSRSLAYGAEGGGKSTSPSRIRRRSGCGRCRARAICVSNRGRAMPTRRAFRATSATSPAPSCWNRAPAVRSA